MRSLPAAALPAAVTAAQQPAPAGKLALDDFQPKSMLVVPEHKVAKARYPIIDVHTHVGGVFGRGRSAAQAPQKSAAELAQIVLWMDELNVRTMLNLTGGNGETLARYIAGLKVHPGRFLSATEPSWEKIREPGYAAWQAEEIKRAKQAGAIGVKVLKNLGLVVRENGREGPLVKVDDTRFDPMWDAAGKLGLPVFIHTADPDAFFTPIDRFNERWDELGNHPNWSFYGKDYPTKPELLAQRNRVIERHPKTTFVCLHVANHPENLDEVTAWLKRYPNMHVEIGARIGELGRQPRRARRFFEEFEDRILFGTDATPNGKSVPQQDLTPAMYQCYFRFLETEDEYFDYAPSAVPPQGRWRIYGIGLPDRILKKVYYNNAARLLGFKLI
ncbi:MAG: amidohydrolase family protein [Candidatus Solibacter usitatus]|nr:amidohydrolase family protein [Candidatus Solibacter usitatus]